MTRPIPDAAVRFIQDEEACVLRVYDDKRPKKVLKPGDKVLGTLTAGYGHTGGLAIGQSVAMQDAKAWLVADLGIAAGRLASVLKPEVISGLSDNQYAALLSFAFNLGVGDWTIWKRLNAGQLDQVPAEMMRFVNSGGERMDGLVNRRTHEVALWNRTAAPAKVDAVPSSVTRVADTPPTPVPPKPLATASLTTKIITATAAVGAGASQAKDLVAPHANVAPIFAKVVAVLTGVIIVCALVGLWISREQHKAAKQ